MSDQTEKATPRRKQKAREEGQFVRSRELPAALVLLVGAVFLGWFSTVFVSGWRTALYSSLKAGADGDLSLLQDNRPLAIGRSILLPALLPIGLLLGSSFCVAALANVAQVGGIVVKKDAFSIKLSRLSPAAQLKQMFSLASVGRLGKSLVPAAVLIFLAAHLVQQHFLAFPALSLARVPQMYGAAHTLLMQGAEVMLGWSALDYLLEWRAHEKRLRMSKQDMRDEMKESEGSPQIKRRIRSIQRQMRRRRIKADVSRASVVVTNPTHYAVALEFSFESMQAPKVLAKGRNIFAEQIKAEARWAGVPVVENPPLARSLYRAVEVGQSIPYDLYAVVAEILAFLYRAELERQAKMHARKAGTPSGNASAPRRPSTHGYPLQPISPEFDEVAAPGDELAPSAIKDPDNEIETSEP